MTRFDRIKKMDESEMACFLEGLVALAMGDDTYIDIDLRKKWLMEDDVKGVARTNET